MSRLSKAIAEKTPKNSQRWNTISKRFKDDFKEKALNKGYVNVDFKETDEAGIFKITGVPAYRIKEIKREMRDSGVKSFIDNQMEFQLSFKRSGENVKSEIFA